MLQDKMTKVDDAIEIDEVTARWVEDHCARNSMFRDLLTPARARELLRRNDGNRRMVKQVQANLENDIRTGKWQYNGESIIVSKDGKLNDGAHRCRAVVATGIAVSVSFVFGVERESRFTVDQGAARTAANQLSMMGKIYSETRAGAARLLIHHERGLSLDQVKVSPTHRPTQQDIVEYALLHDEELTWACGVANTQNKIFRSNVLIALLAVMLLRSSRERERVEEFCQKLKSGAALVERDPILVVRNKFINGKLNTAPTSEKIAALSGAWHSWRKGKRG